MYVWIEINNATLFLPYVLIENIHYRLKQELVYLCQRMQVAQ